MNKFFDNNERIIEDFLKEEVKNPKNWKYEKSEVDGCQVTLLTHESGILVRLWIPKDPYNSKDISILVMGIGDSKLELDPKKEIVATLMGLYALIDAYHEEKTIFNETKEMVAMIDKWNKATGKVTTVYRGDPPVAISNNKIVSGQPR